MKERETTSLRWNFSEALDRHLGEQERSQSWLAKKLKVNVSTVRRWVEGENRPGSPETVAKIADVLGLKGEKRQELLEAAGYAYKEPTEPAVTEEPPSVTAGEILPPSQSQMQASIEPASDDEILIIICTFHHVPPSHPECHFYILTKVLEFKRSLGLENLRVECISTVLRSHERERAEGIGGRYNAHMVIWGQSTGADITVHYLNLMDEEFPISYPDLWDRGFPIPYQTFTSKEHQTYDYSDYDRSAYIYYVTRELPDAATFLCFYAIGRYYFQCRNRMARSVLETAEGCLDARGGSMHFLLTTSISMMLMELPDETLD